MGDINTKLVKANELLDILRGEIETAKDMLDESDEIQVQAVAPLLENLAAQLTKCEAKLEDAVLEIEEIDTFSDEDIAHVLRALKHLGISGIDSLTDASIRMAMEQVVGL
jgi:hypothetical protein